MLKQGLRSIAVVIIILAMAFTLPCSDAFAEHRGGRRGWGDGGRHYYSGSSWYRHGWFGFDIAVSALTIGALIDSLPPRYSTVVVGSEPYYYYGNYYYRPYPYGGYVVVPPPVLSQPVMVTPQFVQPQLQTRDLLTINIPNTRGAYTPVTLKKAGTGYVGPQGEYYSDNPTVEQLKILYGK